MTVDGRGGRRAVRGGLAAVVDHTVLSPRAGRREIVQACREAQRYGFRALCVSEAFLPLVRDRLAGKGVRVACVIDFPFGMASTATRVYQAMAAAHAGADDLDIVIRLPLVLAGRWGDVRDDLAALVTATSQCFHKIILETGLLDADRIGRAARAVKAAGAGCVKTCTGFGPRGARISDIRTIRRAVGPGLRIKSAGGIRTARALIGHVRAGADIVGTSAGPAILKSL